MNTINVLDAQYFNSRDHSAEACFYYPEPEDGKPVIFRGRCDDNISVVRDFDITNVSIFNKRVASQSTWQLEQSCQFDYETHGL